MVGVNALLRHRVVLVEVERHDVCEAQPLVAVHANELAIDADRRRSGREAEHRPLAGRGAFADQRRDSIGDESRDVFVVLDDHGADASRPRMRRA